ncbi:MAG: arginine--tRNA ligase [Chitinophagales bacterium]|nr:arginine--tRNA ligase [Chitinophagaceae bacterium]MCB9065802.1 arginine--tRNA ligase [Chitinophagales bacterium]
MSLVTDIKALAKEALGNLYPDVEIPGSSVTVNQTKPEFTGDYTLVLFPFLKLLRTKPDVIGKAIGEYMVNNSDWVASYDIVAGFLNLTIHDSYWASFVTSQYNNTTYGQGVPTDKTVMVEYSSPNTNKPLHFGHLRNIFLGYAMSGVLEVTGNKVVKANLINDRGIHICKSMVAWQRYANGATPESTGIKGDHLVGDYYVKYNDEFKKEVAQMVADGMEQETAEKEAPILKEAKVMLIDWEAGKEDVVELWKTMNGWVYAGFDVSYKRMGVNFDKMYYESDTYLLGKEVVQQGLEKGVFFKKEDGSIWIDLESEGLDQKIVQRADGTAVYITQDIGTAIKKYEECNLDKSVYVIGDEQNYHMQVLKLILQKFGHPCAEGIYHLSYGMVELPTGKMKSREGTVVDADDMMDEMIAIAKQQTEEAGKTEGFTEEELTTLYETIGLGALKFYLLRVDPKKKMIFDPKESIDLHGFTAAFIQYAHARICSILRKEGIEKMPKDNLFADFKLSEQISPAEKMLAVTLEQYPDIMQNAADEYNPSLLCNYTFQLAQQFNSFYDVHSISKAENDEKKQLRLMLIIMTAQVMRHAMGTMGINLPEKM